MDYKLKHSIFCFLHRYYPENRDSLTAEDWKIYCNFTNYVASDGKTFLVHHKPLVNRLKEIMEEKPEYKSQIILDEVFRFHRD